MKCLFTSYWLPCVQWKFSYVIPIYHSKCSKHINSKESLDCPMGKRNICLKAYSIYFIPFEKINWNYKIEIQALPNTKVIPTPTI